MMQVRIIEIINKLDHLIELHNDIEIIRHVASPIARVEATDSSDHRLQRSSPNARSVRPLQSKRGQREPL